MCLTEVERGAVRSPTCCFTAQLKATQCWARQKPGSSCPSPTRAPGAQMLGPPSAVFPTPLVDNWVGSLWGTNWCPHRMPFSRYAQFTHSWKAESGHPSPGPAHLLTEMKNKRCRLPPLGSFPSHSPSRTSWFTCELQQGSTTMGIRTCCSPTAYHSLPRCFPFKNAFTACPNGKCCAHRMNERKRSKLPFTCPESHS